MPKPESTNQGFLLAIETDATRYHGVKATRPRLLGNSSSEQMLAHIAADLMALLPATRRCKLVAAGALFDQTQILRPGYPVFAALERLLAQSGQSPSSARLSFGSQDGCMAVAELNPEPQIPLGLLQLLPVLMSGDSEIMAELIAAMEHRFLEQGQVSAHTARWLESAFGIKINHARFMTLTDLNAMFRLQLEHFGLLPLWQLIDIALHGRNEPLEVSLENGQVFTWSGGIVHSAFQTFDFWSRFGSGRHVESQRGKLAGGYADWTRVMRQFLVMLKAHGIRLEFCLPEEPAQTLKGSYFIEENAYATVSGRAEVTEHSFAELGTICVTVIVGGRQKNYYPLSPEGLNDIQDAIRECGLGGRTVAFPGTIRFDEKTRTLSAEPVLDQMDN